MIANYGYEDGTGVYYIKINTANCETCNHKNCVKVCLSNVFQMEENDWGDEIIAVPDTPRNNLMTLCQECKASSEGNGSYVCQKACDKNSISHTW